MTLKDISALIQEKVSIYKKSIRSGNENKIPEYTPLYVDAVEMAKAIAVHSEMESFPTELFEAKAPNEGEAERKYREKSYQPETMPLWKKAESNLNRIFNPQNYSLTWETDEQTNVDDNFETYLKEGYPKHNSLISYFQNVVTKRKARDANAVLCVKPYFIPTRVDEAEGENVVTVLDTEFLRPYAVIYHSRQVVGFKDDEFFLILLDEKSTVKTGNQGETERTGLIFELYDRENIYRIEQVGKKSDYEFEISPFFNESGHGYKSVPAWFLGGVPVDTEDGVLYQSHLYNALPALNQALYDYSTLSVCKAGHAFPQRVEYFDPCDADGCNGTGKIKDYDNDGRFITCQTCNGSGHKNKHSPLGVYQLKTPTRLNDGDSEVPFPGVAYVAPDPAILQFLRDEINENKRSSFEFIGLDVSGSKVNGDETATGKLIDREALFSFLMSFSDETFDLLEKTIEAIGVMRYGSGVQLPSVNRPKNFAIRTNQDLTEELKSAKEANLPTIYIIRLHEEIISVRFSDNEYLAAINRLAHSVDRLAMKDDLQIIAGISAGIIPKWQAVLHDNILIYIEDAIIENKEFMNLSLPEQKKILFEKAKKDLLESNPVIASPEDILNGIATGDTPPDLELEAAAKLKGSVGGAQVITGFVEKVSQGEMDYNAALQSLMFLFKIEEAQARLMLGTPNNKPVNRDIAA